MEFYKQYILLETGLGKSYVVSKNNKGLDAQSFKSNFIHVSVHNSQQVLQV